MKIPENYADWMQVLQAAQESDADEDEDVLRVCQEGKLSWQTGVAERFTQHLLDTVNARLDRATDTFQKQMGRAGGQESAVIQAILQLRKELRFLMRFVDIPAIPEENRKQYRQLVKEQADKIQDSLVASARGDRSGKLSSIVRNHPVNR